MEIKTEPLALLDDLKVLIVGNNPIELSRVFQSLSHIEGRKLVTEIAFDFKSIRERLLTFSPNFIFIDDNIGKHELKNVVASLAKRKTKDVPITVLKNSNYEESATVGVLNFLLKETLTSEALYQSFVQSLRLKQTNEFLKEAYRKRKGQLARLLKH